MFSYDSRVFAHVKWRDTLMGTVHRLALIGRFSCHKVHWFVVLLWGFHGDPARWRWRFRVLLFVIRSWMPPMSLGAKFEAQLLWVACIFGEISKVAQSSTVPKDLIVSIKYKSYIKLSGRMQIRELVDRGKIYKLELEIMVWNFLLLWKK